MASRTAPPDTKGHEEHPAQRRVLRVLVVTQILSGAALAAGITVGALLAEEMLGSTGLAGVPSALFTIGAAVGAAGIGRACQRWGRRPGLTLGYGGGAFGSLVVVAATMYDSVPLLFLGLLVYGAGTASVMLARYAGADLASPGRRGRAVSTVLFATAAGAVAGPGLVGVMGDLAHSWDIPRLAGPFLLAFAAFASASLFVGTFLRPDPLLLARDMPGPAKPDTAPGDDGPAPTAGGLKGLPREDLRRMAAGAAVMVLSQVVMIAIMTMTPIHMTDHGHGTGTAGIVIGLHMAAMYLSSPLSGHLVDRVGRTPTAGLGAAVLTVAALTAYFAPPASGAALALALVLLGIGWNLGFVSGTTMVADAAPPDRRAAYQGLMDVGVLIAGAGGSLASGVLVASGGFRLLTGIGAALALVSAVALAARHARPRTAAPATEDRTV
ncbi:MFS transporter [Streptomyces sp. SID4919]|uniref:MFS transporter n=1 Tax=unclassified Streptomyces TaxID=2593676 RepID=UPI000823C877|nr:MULTISPECIES: MFS transporter [unclassified Streptomyces]MYY10391.1 MFS transporter [Streptomyces sp. SID4919]SCK46038.1 Predicted arabinose efflux permease, MFS family [Streptomyces sp. AmelKG-E11A]